MEAIGLTEEEQELIINYRNASREDKERLRWYAGVAARVSEKLKGGEND